MANDRSWLEREIERVELRPFTLEGFHRRRQRKERNRRIGTAVVALAVAAAGIGGLVGSFSSGTVPAGDPRSPFVGTWVSTDIDGSAQTMVVGASGSEAVEVVVHDDRATVCSGAPSTMTGTGRLAGASELVIPLSVLTCHDGSEPKTESGPPVEELLRNITFVHDPESDSLTDNFEVVWVPVAEDPSPEPAVAKPYSVLDGEVTFVAVAPPWEPSFAGWDHGPTMTTLLLYDRYEERLAVVADPLPIETGCREGPAPADAGALARSIRSDPDLVSTEPVAAEIGGIEALRIDVMAAAGASACRDEGAPQVVTETGLYRGHRMRLYLLDLPGGSARILAIAISAPEARFERVVEAAAPVMDSFEFGTG